MRGGSAGEGMMEQSCLPQHCREALRGRTVTNTEMEDSHRSLRRRTVRGHRERGQSQNTKREDSHRSLRGGKGKRQGGRGGKEEEVYFYPPLFLFQKGPQLIGKCCLHAECVSLRCYLIHQSFLEMPPQTHPDRSLLIF